MTDDVLRLESGQPFIGRIDLQEAVVCRIPLLIIDHFMKRKSGCEVFNQFPILFFAFAQGVLSLFLFGDIYRNAVDADDFSGFVIAGGFDGADPETEEVFFDVGCLAGSHDLQVRVPYFFCLIGREEIRIGFSDDVLLSCLQAFCKCGVDRDKTGLGIFKENRRRDGIHEGAEEFVLEFQFWRRVWSPPSYSVQRAAIR